jgi:glycopeptide antibiotics resistance protein
MLFHYVVDTTVLMFKEGFGGERRPKHTVKTWCLYGYLYGLMFFQLFPLFFLNYVLGKPVMHVWE